MGWVGNVGVRNRLGFLNCSTRPLLIRTGQRDTRRDDICHRQMRRGRVTFLDNNHRVSPMKPTKSISALSPHPAFDDEDDDPLGDDALSPVSTPSDFVPLSAFDKQRESLQTYINSVPYECESIEQMQEKLKFIVDKIFVCAKTRNWLVLTTWDGMLQWYLKSSLQLLV